MEFGKRLRLIREKNKLKQKDVAKKLKLGTTTYNGYETGRREPDFETLKKIANFYNCSIDYLLDNSSNDQINSSEPIPIEDDTVAKRIKIRREHFNMSIDELSRLMSADNSKLLLIEEGIVYPSISQLKLLSMVLHTTTDYLIGLVESPEIPKK